MEELLFSSRRSRVVRLAQGNSTVVHKRLNLPRPTPEDLARFRQEHAMMMALKDVPGILRCHELIRHGEALTLVLEDIGGVSLDRIIAAPPLALGDMLDVAVRLAGILVDLHASGVVHRDLSPANILWNPTTGELRLIDFGLADRLPEELAEARPPTLLEGTLAFMPPEQTGRMNRPVDLRSDLYAFGATCYALLTGQPPFPSTDPLTLIADHMARTPEPLHQRRPDTPLLLSRIIQKLLVKEPADRYQSAAGVEADLRRCHTAWANGEEPRNFSLARYDRVESLRFPHRLFGREQELKQLTASLDHVRQGGTRLLLLTGPPGVGKTALAMELRHETAKTGGKFTTGKFDQLRRDRPMAAALMAITELLRHRLADPDETFLSWREALRRELGENLSLLAWILPDTVPIFGVQAAPSHRPPNEAVEQIRQLMVVLLRSLTDPNHPTVLFLDDLQWADPLFLELMEAWLGDPTLIRVLFIGAYRESEISPGHPLSVALSSWEKQGRPISTLPLSPLGEEATAAFLGAALNRSITAVTPLARLLQEKTEGNPFHLRTYLLELVERRQLHPKNGGWGWNREAMQGWPVAQNVVEILIARLKKLNREARTLLSSAACLGFTLDLSTLATALEKTPGQTAQEVERLLETGLLLPMHGDRRLAPWLESPVGSVVYRFAHDRVQEAALALTPPGRHSRLRLELGRRLLAAFPDEAEGDRIFLIADQFRFVPPGMLTTEERPRLARLFLNAGRRAQGAAAFRLAQEHCESGMRLWSHEGWKLDYGLALLLRHEAALCAGALLDMNQLERLRKEVALHAGDLMDLLPILSPLVPLYLGHSKLTELRDLGMEILRYFGLSFSLHPQGLARRRRQVQQEIVACIGTQSPDELAALPCRQESELSRQAHWLLPITMGVYYSTPALAGLIVELFLLRMLRENMRVEDAAWYFCWGSITLIRGQSDAAAEIGYRLGEACGAIVNRTPCHFPQPITDVYFHKAHVLPSTRPLAEVCASLEKDYPLAMGRGHPAEALFSIFGSLMWQAELGEPLSLFRQACNHWLPIMEKFGLSYQIVLIREGILVALGELQGESDATWRRDLAADFTPEITRNRDSFIFLLAHAGKLAFLFRQYDEALRHLTQAKLFIEEQSGSYLVLHAVVLFFESLTLLSLPVGTNQSEQRRIRTTVAMNQQRLARWARHNPANFLHLARLGEAAHQRAMGHPEQALPLCEEALASIRGQSGEVWMPYEALALELMGESLLELGASSVARPILRQSLRVWSRHGAAALVVVMQQRYGALVMDWEQTPTEEMLPMRSDSFTNDRLPASWLIDYPSLLRASQSLASETSLQGVSGRLLSLAMSNAGAEQAFLFLLRNGAWEEVCRGDYPSGEMHFHTEEIGKEAHPFWLDLIRYVARNREAVVLDDAQEDERGTRLPGAPRSVLVTPLHHLGEVIGVLSMIHGQSRGVFTRARLEIVSILGTQAVISLVNLLTLAKEQRLVEEIRSLNAHLEDAAEAEKKRLAGEIHDELGSTLTALKWGVDALEKRLNEESAGSQSLTQLADHALQSVRRISVSLRPPILDRFGLKAALEWLSDQTRIHTGLECRVVEDAEEVELDDPHRIALFRIAQEAITNVVRHAEASWVRIDLRQKDGWSLLMVTDNGKGFTGAAEDTDSFGLSGMKERTRRLGGTFQVKCASGLQETCVTVCIPLPEAATWKAPSTHREGSDP